ncbi:hypothetical protein RF11_10083 [Thelohanellus kitauei]|uniref:Uncharacterized protein n=1 Tax=Thelohanellus kitauei TaxID=669202 RepID=A0A0C2M464_THEKT|nr:hypothetical protein RF11_10083 [Thelohanellus kitauei]
MESENNFETSTGVEPEAEVGSMVQVLIQAIQSRDEALLSELFRQSCYEVVEATSRRLPAEFTLPCLEIVGSINHNDPSSQIRRLNLFLSSRVQLLEELSRLRVRVGITLSNITERYNLSVKTSISPIISLLESCDISTEIEERILNGEDGSNGVESLGNGFIHEKPLNGRNRKRKVRGKNLMSRIGRA